MPGNFPAINLARIRQNPCSPTSDEGLLHLREINNLMSRLIGFQHHRTKGLKLYGDGRFTTRDAADDSDDVHDELRLRIAKAQRRVCHLNLQPTAFGVLPLAFPGLALGPILSVFDIDL